MTLKKKSHRSIFSKEIISSFCIFLALCQVLKKMHQYLRYKLIDFYIMQEKKHHCTLLVFSQKCLVSKNLSNEVEKKKSCFYYWFWWKFSFSWAVLDHLGLGTILDLCHWCHTKRHIQKAEILKNLSSKFQQLRKIMLWKNLFFK